MTTQASNVGYQDGIKADMPYKIESQCSFCAEPIKVKRCNWTKYRKHYCNRQCYRLANPKTKVQRSKDWNDQTRLQAHHLIRRLWMDSGNDYTQQQLADIFRLSPQTISRIIRYQKS